MRVLFDECVPKRLRQELPGHVVRTVFEMGWSGAKNDELLRNAATECDCFVTVDRNLQFQQNVPELEFGVIVLHAQKNDIESLRPLLPKALAAIASLKPGQVINV